MTFFCPLASGSKGNAVYLEYENRSVLIDVGINLKQLTERLKTIERSLDQIDAILITHEHSDHIAGLKALSEYGDFPVYASRETAKVLYQEVGPHLNLQLFTPGISFLLGQVKVTPFAIYHDTVDPVAFTLEAAGFKMAVCTDLGCVTPIVEHHLKGSHLLYLEANHDPQMVYASARPNVYKQRVLSRQGHLSNSDCASLVCRLWHPDLQVLYLAHLSSECNTPAVALNTVVDRLAEEGRAIPKIYIALQDEVSPSEVWQEV